MYTQQDSTLLSFLPMIILLLYTGITNYYVAKDKGRNVPAWTIVGLIPVVGFLSFVALCSLSCLITRRKLDEILENTRK
mgnify:CR=1 FL=1